MSVGTFSNSGILRGIYSLDLFKAAADRQGNEFIETALHFLQWQNVRLHRQSDNGMQSHWKNRYSLQIDGFLHSIQG